MTAKYQCKRLLGSGSFGNVFLARKGGKCYAIKKVINAELNTARREIAVLQRVNHSNIIKYHGHYIERGVFCLVLEYADRGTLKDAMRRAGPNPWTETDVWMFITQMSRALNYLHSMSPPILHRDLKPDNILGVNKPVGPGGGRQMFSWKLADFGVARILTQEAQTAYFEDNNPAVAIYRAPEVLRHENYTAASDMWSLGCVIAFVTNKGRPLFECKGDVLRYSGNYFVKEFAAVLRGVFYRLLRVCSSIWGKIYLFNKPFFIP